MRITHKAVYNLLHNSYARRSLNEFIHQDVTEDILNASILFAEDKEQYIYLAVMVNNRVNLDKEYSLFISPSLDHPIVLKKDADLTLVEFAILYKNCNIHISEFKTIVESTAEGLNLDAEKYVKTFEGWATSFKEVPKEAL